MKRSSARGATVQINFDCDPMLAGELERYVATHPGTNRRMVHEVALARFFAAEKGGGRSDRAARMSQ